MTLTKRDPATSGLRSLAVCAGDKDGIIAGSSLILELSGEQREEKPIHLFAERGEASDLKEVPSIILRDAGKVTGKPILLQCTFCIPIQTVTL